VALIRENPRLNDEVGQVCNPCLNARLNESVGQALQKTFARQLKEKSFRVNTNEFASTAQNIVIGLQY